MIPCHVIAGPLGVGKTTAILDFLKRRADDENIAVIVNDFGKAGLDAEVLSGSGAEIEVRNIAGGCLCCSTAVDMRESIQAVRNRAGLTRLIIEPSGLVVMPDFVPYLKRLCEEFEMELKPIIGLLAPKRTKESHYKALPYFGTLVDHSDVLVGNRIDQCNEQQLEHFRDWTARLEPPKLRVIETSFGHLPDELFEMSREAKPPSLKFYLPHTHEESSGGMSIDVAAVSESAFVERMEKWIREGLDGAEVLRFKATLPADDGWRLFEIADATCYVREMPDSTLAKLDWISRGEVSDSVMLEELASCQM